MKEFNFQILSLKIEIILLNLIVLGMKTFLKLLKIWQQDIDYNYTICVKEDVNYTKEIFSIERLKFEKIKCS